MTNVICVIPVFLVLACAAFMCRKILAGEKISLENRLKTREDVKIELSEDFDKLDRFENGIRRKEVSIVSMYEITKKMSARLKFDEIFETFSDFVKDILDFRRCDLVVLNWAEESPRIERTYGIGEGIVATEDYERLVKFALARPMETYMTRVEDGPLFEELGIKKAGVDSLCVIPLLSEKRMVAVLAVENLIRPELEKFAILAMQFALEIKKVLLYETVEKLAITDSLTKLYVRRYFVARFGEELQRSRRYKFNFAFLMADIDDFKKANDTYGHLVGDVLLKDIGRIIKESVREIDLISRYGGEEFAALLPETGREGALVVAERIRKKVAETIFSAYDEKVKVTISIGLAVYPDDATDSKGMMDKADAALYAAKRSGKNLVCESRK